MFSGLKTWAIDHVIAGSLKEAAEGKYGSFAKNTYWWIEANAFPISVTIGSLDVALKSAGVYYPQVLQFDNALMALTGVFGLLGVTIGVHAAEAPKK